MIRLNEHINDLLTEGGLAGHMSHPIDFSYFTPKDLKQLISDIFSGKIEDITEKVDGMNVQATMNNQGEVVFLRNQKDLQSENGGMTLKEMMAKWSGKPQVLNTFVSAGKTIKKVFGKIGSEFFNPASDKKRVVNCECVIAGVTNIIPYSTAQVDFHDIYIYKRMNEGWVIDEVTKKGLDVIEKACDGLDDAKLSPHVIIQITDKSNDMIEKYGKMIDMVFGREEDMSIDQWKYRRFVEEVSKKWPWVKKNEEGMKILYNRWFNNDKKTNIRLLKSTIYPDHCDELMDMEIEYRDIVDDIIEPLDTLFLRLGNDVIRMCAGLMNGSNNDNVIRKLQDDMRKVIKDVKAEGSRTAQTKMVKQLKRLERLGGDDSINSAEGIVFRYKGKLMKLTGSFACMNQLLNIKKL